MSRVNETKNVTNNIILNLNNKVNQSEPQTINISFGNGHASIGTEFISVDSRFQTLAPKFDFELPKYPKGGFAQFAPTDSDYEKMKHLDAILDKAEAPYCEK